ncbi:MAG: hypothetical protein JKY50_00130 [Oleispira sp.]|nr:hypothetical protein [Oleispira sp.]
MDNPLDFAANTEALDGTSDVRQTEDPNSVQVQDRAITAGLLAETSPDVIKEEASIGELTTSMSIREETLSKVNVNDTITAGIERQASIEELEAESQDIVNKVRESQDSDLTVETDVLMSDVGTSAVELRFLRRTSWAEAFITEEVRKLSDDTSTVGVVGDFIDRFLIRQIVMGTIDDLTDKTGARGEELLDAAMSPILTDDAYKTFILEKIEEMKGQGVFTRENLFAMQDLLESATNRGFNPNARMNAAFAGLDVLLVAAPLASKVSKLKNLAKINRASSPTQKMAAIKGPDVAGEAAGKISGTHVDPELMDDLLPPPESIGNKSLPTNNARTQKILETNETTREITSLLRQGVAGRIASPDEIALAVQKTVTRVARGANRPVSTWVELPKGPTGEVAIDVRLGKVKDGSAYPVKGSAQKAANRIDGARVEPVNDTDLSQGWQVVVRKRVDLTGASDPFKVQSVFSDAVREVSSRVMGTTALRDLEHLNTLAQMGESAGVAFKRAAGPQLKALNKLKNTDRSILDRIMENLRDGDASVRRETFTDAEFTDEWIKQDPKGLPPTDKQREAFTALKELSDTAWLLEASEALQKYVRNGFEAVQVSDDLWLPAKKIEDVTEEILSELSVTQRGLVEGRKTSLWRLEKSLDNGDEFVVNPTGVRILEYEDVFGFNAGGRRANNPANYFVMLTDDSAGKSLRPKAVLTSFTQGDAAKAVDELTNISDAKRAGTLTDEVVQANNDWNPSINTVSELDELATTKGWDLSRGVSFKARDIPLEGIDETNPFAGSSSEKFFRNDMRRGDDVLMEYGGADVHSSDPIKAVTDQFGTAVRQVAMRAHSLRAIDSWLKTAAGMPSIKLDSALANSPRMQFARAEIFGKSPSDLRMGELRSITQRRLGMKNSFERSMERIGQQIAEYVSDKFGKQITAPNLEGNLMGVAFQSAFGFMNISQFFMQSAHASVVMAISPRHGVVGLGRVIPMRMLLSVKTLEAEQEGIKRFAKFANMSEEDATELVTYIKTSARDVLDGDVADAGTGVGYGVSGWRGESYLSNALGSASKGIKKAAEIGLTPFNQGERLSRLTGINTAFAEFKAIPEHKGISALSDYGRGWITRREQTLNFNMTTGSRPFFQSGVAKIPTQWMSYSFRAMEAIAFGTGGLTKFERLKLFGVLGPMYGMTGLGMEAGADYVSELFDLEPESDYNDLIRFGVLDFVIGEATGAETALGSRLAPFTIIKEIAKDVTEGSLIEAVAGPSGQISKGIFDAIVDTSGDIIHGREVQVTESVIRLLRQPSAIDKFFGAYGVWNNGVYRSKNGVKFKGELSSSDAVQLMFGFTPAQMVEIRQRRTEMYMDGKTFKAFNKDMTLKSDRAWELMSDTNQDLVDRGHQMLKEIHAEIELRPLSETMKGRVRRSVTNGHGDAILQLQRNLVDRDRTWARDRVEVITNKGGN